MANEGGQQLLVNRWGDTSSAPGPAAGGEPCVDTCSCFDQRKPHPRARVGFHTELQDTSAPGWQHLLELIDEAAADGREEFRPLVELSPGERRQVITLPPTIGKLTAVKHLVLYGSNLVRLPPDIGAMTSLEEFTPYTSYRMHWFPYEITRCTRLMRSTVSTRSLFGNHKLRAPFPRLAPPSTRSQASTRQPWTHAAGARQPSLRAASATSPWSKAGSIRSGSPCAWPRMSCRSWSTHALRDAWPPFPGRLRATSNPRTRAGQSANPQPTGTELEIDAPHPRERT